MRDDDGPLVIVSRPEGAVVGENAAARKVFGHPDGEPCWKRVGSLEETEGMPCEEGCTARLIGTAKDQRSPLVWKGDPFELTCVPVNGKIVSVLSPCLTPTGEQREALTERERDVLRLLAEGMTSGQIGDVLGIGTGTVRTHVEHLREKLEVPTRAAIVGRAFRLGYLR